MKSFIQFYKNLSLRTKLIILLVSVPLLMLSSYLALVLRVVEVDKMGYVYETSVNLSKSFSAQVKSDLSMALLKLQPLLQSYLTRGYWDSFDQGLFAKESEFWVLAVLNPANGEALPFIEKNLGIWADFKVAQSALVDEIKNLAPGKRIIKGIGDQKLVIAETISDEKTKKQLTYLFIYWAKDIGGIFESGQGTKIYLVDKNGKALLGPVDFKETDLLERFPQKITGKLNSSKALDSAEILVSEKDQMQWLVSISNSGFGDLAVVSLIEKSQALAALKILLLKSIVFFVLLVALSIIISLFFSKYLTAALRLLVDATKRISTGRFDVQWQADSLDEVGVLSSNFRVMSDEIQRLLIETKDNARMEAELKTAQIVQ